MVSITDKAEFLNFWNREAVEFNTLHSHQIMFDEKTIFETFFCIIKSPTRLSNTQ